MDAKISVIVPVYKVEAYLDECVESILHQTHSNLEVILVDDGSPDKSPQMCEKWAVIDPRVIVVHKQNGGLSSARNAGLDICSGDYIAFVDSDDWIKPEMFQIMLNAAERESADICACSIIRCFPKREAIWGAKEYTVGNTEKMLDMLYSDEGFPVSAWNKLYKRKMWEGFRFPEGKLCEDAFTTYLLLDRAERIVQITDALYCYRIRPESIMTTSFTHQKMDEEEAWRKNYEFVQKKYPQLFRKAYSYYLQSVSILLHRIKKEQREQFRAEYDYLRRIILKNVFFMMFQSSVSIKYRLRYLLDLIQG